MKANWEKVPGDPRNADIDPDTGEDIQNNDETTIIDRRIVGGTIVTLKKLNSAFAPWKYQVDASWSEGRYSKQMNCYIEGVAREFFEDMKEQVGGFFF